jgi:hypothetical protein
VRAKIFQLLGGGSIALLIGSATMVSAAAAACKALSALDGQQHTERAALPTLSALVDSAAACNIARCCRLKSSSYYLQLTTMCSPSYICMRQVVWVAGTWFSINTACVNLVAFQVACFLLSNVQPIVDRCYPTTSVYVAFVFLPP